MRASLAATLRAAAGHAYWALPHFLARARGRVMILMYHRVLPRGDVPSACVQPGMYVTQSTFERHLRFLRTYFETLSFPDLLRRWSAGDWSESTRYCLVTFDDGWLDTYRHAFPLLRAYRLPATVFLPTALVGSAEPLWTDRLADLLRRRGAGRLEDWDAQIECAKQLDDGQRAEMLDALAAEVGEIADGRRRYIDWAEAREMSACGITFGSHTMTHANLTRLTAAALDRELRGSLDVLRAQEGVNWVPALAYPNGDYTAEVAAATRAAGYRAALTTRPGLETGRPADPYRLARIGLHEDVSGSVPETALHIARVVRSCP
jgi:peptidoglycan/xylan/chitin deacetylase (PgdA/CDA1 family)